MMVVRMRSTLAWIVLLVMAVLLLLAASSSVLLCCHMVLGEAGCYDALLRDLSTTVSGKDVTDSTEAFRGSCEEVLSALGGAAADGELWLTEDDGSSVQVVFTGEAARLLRVPGVETASECALQEPRDFLGDRGVLVRTWRRPPRLACEGGPPNLRLVTLGRGGCLRLLLEPGRRLSKRSHWLPHTTTTTTATSSSGDVILPPPRVALQGSSGRHVRIVHAFPEAARGATLAFYTRRTQCQFTHTRQDLTWFLQLTGKTDPDAIVCKNDRNRQVSCGMTEKLEVGCNITQLAQGNYCLYAVVMNEDRCRDATCVFYTPLAVREHAVEVELASPGTPTVPVRPRGAPAVLVVAVLALTVLGTLLCLLVHFLWPQAVCLRSPWKLVQAAEGGSTFTVSETVPERNATAERRGTEIVLLYAQDCRSFMDVVAHFRALLANIPNTRVYDVFDVSAWDEIGRDPGGWLCGVMSRPAVRVVLVESACACLHQRGLYRPGSRPLSYREAAPYSQLFLQGLTLATHNVITRAGAYNTHYVVRFEEAGAGAEQLSHVTPFRRYVLPETILPLLQDVYAKAVSCDAEDLETLRQKVDAFVQFKRSDPDYLRSLLSQVEPSYTRRHEPLRTPHLRE